MKANVPTRKKIKLNWFKSGCKLTIERKIDTEYTAYNVSSNKINWDVIVKYVLIKEGDAKEIPIRSPMTLYKNSLPFLFLNTAESIGTKIISEDLIDSDIIVDDLVVQVIEGEAKVTYEDARNPQEHIEVRTRYDRITRKVNIENKLDNAIDMEFVFKQTKDVTFVKSEPVPGEIEEPEYKYKINIGPESSSKISLELQAKIVSRVTKIKPEFLKPKEK